MNLPGFLTGFAPDGAPWKPHGRWGICASHIHDYMRRYLVMTPWGMIRLHHIKRSDSGRDFHDHPADFWSILLTGGYREWTPTETGETFRDWPRFSLVRRKAEDLHRLELSRPVWTLCIFGPKRRTWGFLLADSRRWVPWRDYHNHGVY